MVTAATNEDLLVDYASQLTIARGVWTLLFGVFVLVWPKLTLATFIILAALWLLVSGVTGIVGALVGKKTTTHWFLQLVLGVVQVGVGAYLVQRPGITLLTVVSLLAIALVVEGVVDIVSSVLGGGSFGDKMLMLLNGALAIIIGVFVWRYPVHGTLAFLWMLGIYALVAGSFMLASGAALRNATK